MRSKVESNARCFGEWPFFYFLTALFPVSKLSKSTLNSGRTSVAEFATIWGGFLLEAVARLFSVFLTLVSRTLTTTVIMIFWIKDGVNCHVYSDWPFAVKIISFHYVIEYF